MALETAQPQVQPSPGPASARVLVIEDQQDARESLRMLLELDKHEVETAANGREGVAKFDAFAPTVVLVDIGLPEMNDYEVAHAIRSRENGTRACLISGVSGFTLVSIGLVGMSSPFAARGRPGFCFDGCLVTCIPNHGHFAWSEAFQVRGAPRCRYPPPTSFQ